MREPLSLGKIETAILVAWELQGVASRLDVVALEQFLQNPSDDFRYERHCRACIEFRRALDAIAKDAS